MNNSPKKDGKQLRYNEEGIPNAETVAALEEYDEMKRDPEKYKRYKSFKDAIGQELDEADEDADLLSQGTESFCNQ